MIPRYSRPQAADIWSAQTKYRIWFEIEAHAADAMAELGVIPKAAAEAIWAKGKDAVSNPDRIDEIERVDQARRHRLPHPCGRDRRARGALPAPGHDLVGRARHLPGRAAGPAADLLIEDVDLVLAALKRRAFEHKFTPTHRAAATASTPSRPPSA